ncbi:MAG: hypothetical protein ABMA64_29445 [Myxococcota bacterium]
MRTLPLWLVPLAAGCWPYIPRQLPVDDPNATIDPVTLGDDDDDGPGWSAACAEGPNKTGPWNDHPIARAGVDTRSSDYSFDAGVGAVLDAAKNASNPKNVNLTITDAIVTAVDDDGPTLNAMIADKSGTVVLYRLPVDFAVTSLYPGDRVQVRATEVLDYGGIPEITEGTVEPTGIGENVFVRDGMNGDALDFDRNPLDLHEVWGELVTGGTPCGGGMECFDLDHGANRVVGFRAPEGSVGKGDCVHLIAPLAAFDGVPELSMDHPDWYRTY